MSTNPIEGFLDLIKLRETLEKTVKARKATQDALNTLKRYEAQMDASTIKKVESQLKKMETAVSKAIKALSTASKKKIPQELKDAYKKGMKVLKKTLPASVFGKPSYSYRGDNRLFASFYIWQPLQDHEDIGFKFTIEFQEARAGRRSWSGDWIPAEPAKVKTRIAYFFNGDNQLGNDIEKILEKLRHEGYVHYPNIAGLKAEKDALIAQMKKDVSRLPRYLEGEVEGENTAEPYISVEGRAEMRWEYDRDEMSRKEWRDQGQEVINDVIERLKKILPNYDYATSWGMGDEGFYNLKLTPKK